ncbi:uncharacterized protein NECHADRAFT_80841 [Fusarium vanettenii 77-13-4]|uniref:Uncharacterized protein n=1 Tax=Fusarium vanettenii (strain ATCC MYA-4622 / CBS 123669 / FGSC 9596 / NRRL 45880 / 77-13-4) TaxID=660122 RepID=C7YST1_FUSV7|nr:uncharacterized protein NECHADRAFT_80841 [Fusarium vanettenii 77-13-4]EEU45701.1 predicted protein [Fusarium vanettenii 77-13-4]
MLKIKRDTPLLPECQGDDAGARTQRDRDSDTKPSTTKKPLFWWNPRNPLTGPGESTVVTVSWLWHEFHFNLTGAKYNLKKYLEHMNNIRTATSFTCASLDELQVSNATRIFPRRQEPVFSVPSSTFTQGVDIDQEKRSMKDYEDRALSNLHQMDEILDLIEMVPEPDEPLVPIDMTIWTVVFLYFAATIPFQPLARFSLFTACIFSLHVLERPLSKWFKRYNLACVHQQVRDLLRALEDERISDKNMNDPDSWHMWARLWMFVKFDRFR